MKTRNYQLLTLIFAALFLTSLTLNIIPNNEQSKYNNLCQRVALDYAKLDLTFAKFECCKIFEVSDPQLNMTYKSEGCIGPFDFVDN